MNFNASFIVTYFSLLALIREFLGPTVISGEKIQSMGTYTKWSNATLWIFMDKGQYDVNTANDVMSGSSSD